jgi:hypothetical protein
MVLVRALTIHLPGWTLILAVWAMDQGDLIMLEIRK